MAAHATRLVILIAAFGCAWAQPPQPRDQASMYWDRVYSADKPIFSLKPTELLVSAVLGRPRGRALDIGMGQGRNALFLAEQGWDVTGFDLSQEGVRQAQAEAGKRNVRLNAVVSREEDFELRTAVWDLIVMTYVRRIRAGDAERFTRALKPGGIFVYENNNVGKPNELLRQFTAFRILRFEDVDVNSDWHPDTKQRVERLIAQKVTEPPANADKR
jgi:SAM-dependent methyltransferase